MATEKRLDLIDRKALEEHIGDCYGYPAVDILHEIATFPGVDAVEVVHGRWVEHRPNVYECTACNTWYGNYGGCEEWAYCPHCGAKMDGGNADGCNGHEGKAGGYCL